LHSKANGSVRSLSTKNSNNYKHKRAGRFNEETSETHKKYGVPSSTSSVVNSYNSSMRKKENRPVAGEIKTFYPQAQGVLK
jgi:hypothetical protein